MSFLIWAKSNLVVEEKFRKRIFIEFMDILNGLEKYFAQNF